MTPLKPSSDLGTEEPTPIQMYFVKNYWMIKAIVTKVPYILMCTHMEGIKSLCFYGENPGKFYVKVE